MNSTLTEKLQLLNAFQPRENGKTPFLKATLSLRWQSLPSEPNNSSDCLSMGNVCLDFRKFSTRVYRLPER